MIITLQIKTDKIIKIATKIKTTLPNRNYIAEEKLRAD
jgi:hypothetical protein